VALASNGTLAYVPGDVSISTRNVLAFADKTGKAEALPLPPGAYGLPRLSPDGRQIAFNIEDGQHSDVWIYELSGGRQPRKLTFDGISGIPAWTADSQSVIFASADSMVLQRADGTGPRETLVKPEQGIAPLPQAVSGNVLAFTPLRGNAGGISLVSLDKDRKIEPFAENPGTIQIHAAFSPNGDWLAYMSSELKGVPQVFVQPFPKTGAKYQVTTDGAAFPLWSINGKQLFYVSRNRLFVVDIQTEPRFSVGTPSELPIRGALFPIPGLRNYDVTKDGRFLVVLPAALDTSATQPAGQIHVVLNWLEELKQRVPVR
jgi:Tol biopolymer transport system component